MQLNGITLKFIFGLGKLCEFFPQTPKIPTWFRINAHALARAGDAKVYPQCNCEESPLWPA